MNSNEAGMSIYQVPEWGQVRWPHSYDISPNNDLVFVAKSQKHGIGCFAKQNIPSGTIISVSPVVFIWGGSQMEAINSTGLGGYPFTWGECVDESTGEVEPLYCFALGIGAIYNHSASANCVYAMVDAGQEYHGRAVVCSSILHITTCDVVSGDELTTDYSGGNPDGLWFDPVE